MFNIDQKVVVITDHLKDFNIMTIVRLHDCGHVVVLSSKA